MLALMRGSGGARRPWLGSQRSFSTKYAPLPRGEGGEASAVGMVVFSIDDDDDDDDEEEGRTGKEEEQEGEQMDPREEPDLDVNIEAGGARTEDQTHIHEALQRIPGTDQGHTPLALNSMESEESEALNQME